MHIQLFRSLTLSIAVLAPIAHAISGEVPGTHPSYLHAVTELQSAEWLIQHRRGSPAVEASEGAALQSIAGAISDTRNAAMIDGKDLRSSPPSNLSTQETRRMWLARDNLVQARFDLTRREDNPSALAARDSAVQHVDDALSAVQQAIRDIEQGH